MKSITWFNLKGRLKTTDTSVAISNDNRGNVVTLTNESVVAVTDDNKTFEMMQINAATGTLSVVKRGLDNSTTKTEVSGNKKERGPGTRIYITALASDFVASNTPNTWTAKQTFGDVDITGILNMGIVGDLNVLGTSNPQPNFTDTTARDLVYTAPVNGDKCTVGGYEQTYNGSTAQRETFGISTPVPDATEIAKGKARLATEAEALEGIDDTTIMTPKKVSAQYPIAFYDKSYMLGEPAVAGNSLFLENGPTFAQASTAQNVGDTTGNTRVSFPAIGTGIAGNAVKLALAKVGSPTAFLRVRIETDNAGSPSGTLIDAGATKDIDPATLTTSLADTTVLMGATVANTHGVTLNVNETSQTVYKGVKFTLTQQVGAVSVDKVAGCTATKAYLYDLAGNLLTSATFSTNTATLNYNGLVNGTSYYIMAGSDGSSYTSVKQTGASAYPYTAGRLNYVGGIDTQLIANNYSFVYGNTETGGTTASGEAIVPNSDIIIYSIVKHGSCSATRCLIKSDNGTTLFTTSFTGNNAIFTTQPKLLSGIKYRIELDSSGGTVDHAYDFNVTYPRNTTNFSFVASSRNGSDYNTSYYYNISNINTFSVVADTDINNITSISINDTILIPAGQKVHIVTGVVGDVVNASNYYKIGYSTNDTTTRGLKLYDGSVYGSSVSTKWCYISSTLFQDKLLSLTDADYTYKLPNDIIRVATATYGVGTYPKCTIYGIDKTHTGMGATVATQYIGNTPGSISSSAGTNSFVVGKSIADNLLRVRDIIS